MEEKRTNLRSIKQRALLQKLVEELGRKNPQLYYQSTMQIAFALKDHIAKDAKLDQEDADLVSGLKPKDIQIILGVS